MRGVMLHPVRVPPASGSLPPRMFPRGIPSAALPDAVTSPLRHAAPAPARSQARYHSHSPATTHPTARRAAVPAPPVPLRFTAARLAAPPRHEELRAPACGIMFVPHIMPPAPKNPVATLWELRFGNVVRVVHIGGSRGHLRALRRQVLSSSFPALPRSCLTCAAWSFLRDHLTPRPAVAKNTYRFCVRKIRRSPALQNTGKGGGTTTPAARVPGEVGWASMVQVVTC
jgi:hypothetical protein